MFRYGKLAQAGIAAASYLAAHHGAPGFQARSSEIADARNLSRPLVAKLLTKLSAAGIVSGRPGPGGGYRLAVAPETLSLYELVAVFERPEPELQCPFGPGWCGRGDPCPLHDSLLAQNERFNAFLRETRLEVFVAHEPSAAVRTPAPHPEP